MSHLCKMKTQWKDIHSVEKACEILGYTLVKGGNVRSYYGQGQSCDYTIEFNRKDIATKYNAGLVKNKKGHYDFLVDNSISGAVITDTSIQADGKVKTGGKTTDLIKDLQREYSTDVVRKIAKKKNFRMKVGSTLTPNGYRRIKLST